MHDGHPVAVFWDYENCRPPSSVSGYELVRVLNAVVHEFGWIKHLNAYLDIDQASSRIRSELQCSGVSLIDCPHNGRKNVADGVLLVDMLGYAMDHPAPATIVLISGDRDFAYAASMLRQRKYKIILISPTMPGPHISLASQVALCLDWTKDVISRITPDSDSYTTLFAHNLRQPYTQTPDTSTKMSSPTTPPVAQLDDVGSLKEPFPSYVSKAKVPIVPPCPILPAPPVTPAASPPRAPANDEFPEAYRFLAEKLAVYHRKGLHRPDLSQIAIDVSTDRFCYARSVFENFEDLTAQAVQAGVVSLGGDENGPFMSIHPTWWDSFVRATPTPSSLGDSQQRFPETLRLPFQFKTDDTSVVPPTFPPFNPTPPHQVHSADTVPSKFRALVKRLEIHLNAGTKQPLLSTILKEIPIPLHVTPEEEFTELVSEANKAGIILLGGQGDSAWLSIHPQWRNDQPQPSDGGEQNPPTTETSTTRGDGLPFSPLIAVLSAFSKQGNLQPLRSQVGAQVANFSSVSVEAANAGVVLLGGTGGKAWIKLTPKDSCDIETSKVAAHFVPLVHVLQEYRDSGVNCPTRADVAGRLLIKAKDVLQDAGVDKFKKYIKRAKKAGFLVCGGEGLDAWLSLSAEYSNR